MGTQEMTAEDFFAAFHGKPANADAGAAAEMSAEEFWTASRQPAGTYRYAGPGNELAARAGRGILAVPGQAADALAGTAAIVDQVAGAVSRIPMPQSGDLGNLTAYNARVGRALSAMDPRQAASIDARTKINTLAAEIRQLEAQVSGPLSGNFGPGSPGWDQLNETQRMRLQDQARMNARPEVAAKIRAEIDVRRKSIEELMRIAGAAENELAQTTMASDLATGAIQVGDEYNAVRDRTLPMPSQEVTGERSWYHPMSLVGSALENAPQIAIQTAAAYGSGGTGVMGALGRAGRFASAGTMFELADATRQQVQGFRDQGVSDREALARGALPAGLVASVNTALEGLSGLGLFPDEAAKEAARTTLLERALARAGAGARGFIAEGLPEAAQEGVGGVGTRFSGADQSQKSFGDVVQQMAQAGVVGGLTGAAVGLTESQSTNAARAAAAGRPVGTVAGVEGADGAPAVTGAPEAIPQAANDNVGQARDGNQGVQDGMVPQAGDLVDPAAGVVSRGSPDVPTAEGAAQVEPGADPRAGLVPPGDARGDGAGPMDNAPAGAQAESGTSVDLTAVEEAGRRDAADGLEPEALPDGTDPAIVEAYTRGYEQSGRAAAPQETQAATPNAAATMGNPGETITTQTDSPIRSEAGTPVPEPSGKTGELSWAERAAARLEAQAAEMTRGNTGPRGSGLMRSGSTNLPAELVAIAYRVAAKVLRSGSRTFASIRAAVDVEAKDRTPEERRQIARAVLVETRKAAEAAKAETVGPEAVRDIRVAMTAREQGRAEGRSEATQTAKAQAFNAAQVVKQKNERRTVAKMLEANMKGRAQGQAQGFREGVAAGKAVAAKPKPLTAKQQVAKTTGLVDDGDAKTVSQRDALAASMKAQEKASAIGYREGLKRVAEAVTLAKAAEREKGRTVVQKYDRARKVVRAAIENNLPLAERGRFLAMLDGAKTPLQVARGLRRVAAAATSLDARALLKSVDEMSGTMELRKLSAERRKSADALIAQAEALRAAVGRPDAENPERMQAMAAAGKALRTIDAELAALYADQKAADTAFAADKRRTAAEHAQVLVANISAAREAHPEGSGKAGAQKQGRGELLQYNDFVGMASMLEGKTQNDSVLASKWNLMRQADLERADAALELRNKMNDAAKVAGYSDLTDLLEKAAGEFGKASVTTHKVKMGTKSIALTVDEIMQLYLDLKDSSTRALYESGMGVVQADNAGGSKLAPTMAQLEAAVEKLTPAQKKAADVVGSVIRSLGPDISKVHKALTGRELELSPDYAPRRRSKETTDAPKDPPSGWAGVRGAMLENSPFTQEREGGTERARVLGGLFRDALDYIDTATRMIHMAQPVREIYAITGSGPVREAIADRYGEVMNKRLDQFIMAAAGTTRTQVTTGGKLVASVNSLLASANLTLRPTTLLQNSASVIRLAPVMDSKTFADGLAGAKDVSAEDINAIGYFAERFNTDPGARASGIGTEGSAAAQSQSGVRRGLIAAARSASRLEVKDAWRSYRRAMGSIPVMNMAEMIPAKVAYAGYLAESKRLNPNRTEAEHRKYAGHKAAMAFRQIQNASSAMDQSTAQLTVKGTGTAGLLLFGSDTIRTFQRLRQAERDGTLGKFLAAEATNIASSTVIKKSMRAALTALGASLGGDDDEWERFKKEDLALESWARSYIRDFASSTVPVIGGLLTPAAEKGVAMAFGEKQTRSFRDFEPAIFSIATDAAEVWNDLARAGEASAKGDQERAAKAYTEALTGGAGFAMTAAGVPLKPLADYARSVMRSADPKIDSTKEAEKAVAAMKDGNAEDTKFYVVRLLAAGDKPLSERRTQVINLLENHGPKGSDSDEAWRKRLAAMDPATRRAKRAEQAEWERQVGQAVRGALAAAARRRAEETRAAK